MPVLFEMLALPATGNNRLTLAPIRGRFTLPFSSLEWCCANRNGGGRSFPKMGAVRWLGSRARGKRRAQDRLYTKSLRPSAIA